MDPRAKTVNSLPPSKYLRGYPIQSDLTLIPMWTASRGGGLGAWLSEEDVGEGGLGFEPGLERLPGKMLILCMFYK
jgi:hypothetical protein